MSDLILRNLAQHKSLETLDGDVLQVILQWICNVDDILVPYQRKRPWKYALPLSVVSKRLRFECLPHLFREWRYKIIRPGRLLPSHLWQYIKVLQLVHPGVDLEDIDDQAVAAAELYDQFPKLEAVTTCIYTRVPGPTPVFIGALTTLPSLSSLELRNSTFQIQIDPEFHVIKGLTRLVFHLDGFWRRRYPASVWSDVEAHYLMILLSGSTSTLEYVEVPASSVFLAVMSGWHWPNLRHLVLHDNARPLDAPLGCLLQQTPRIHTVAVKISRTSDEPQFVIYPDPNGRTPFLDIGIGVPGLKSLTLTNPSPDDLIFHSLSDVRYLAFSVLPIPTCYVESVSILRAPIWGAAQAVEVLRYCKKPFLTELRISVQGEGLSDLVRCIPESCPSLKTLELHRYPKGRPTLVQPFDICLADLARLSCLKELRLDLNIMRNESVRKVEQPTPELDNLEHERSLLIAENLPQLKVIGFLFRKPDQTAYWTIRNVSRKAGLTVELEDLHWENYPFDI